MIDLRWPQRMHSNGRPCHGSFLLAGWHPAWSITWIWALYWHASKRLTARLRRNRNGGGEFALAVPFLGELSLRWQRALRGSA